MFIISFNVHCVKILCYCSAEGAIRTSVGYGSKSSVHLSYILSSNLVVRLNARSSMSWEVFKLSPIFHLAVCRTDFLRRIKSRDKTPWEQMCETQSEQKSSIILFVYEILKFYRKQHQVGYMYKTILNLFNRRHWSLYGNVSLSLNFFLLGLYTQDRFQ